MAEESEPVAIHWTAESWMASYAHSPWIGEDQHPNTDPFLRPSADNFLEFYIDLMIVTSLFYHCGEPVMLNFVMFAMLWFLVRFNQVVSLFKMFLTMLLLLFVIEFEFALRLINEPNNAHNFISFAIFILIKYYLKCRTTLWASHSSS